MKELVGAISAVLALAVYFPYICDALRGRTRPHPFSWLIWGTTSLVIFAQQTSGGAGGGAYSTFSAALFCLIVSVIGFRRGLGAITRMDFLALAAAFAAAALWLVVGHGLLAMILLVSTELIGLVPSLQRGWKKPHDETLSLWSINAARHVLSIVALGNYSLITLLNPVVWAITDALFAGMLIYRRKSTRPAETQVPESDYPSTRNRSRRETDQPVDARRW